MIFELNEYHHNVSDEELINDVIYTAKKVGKKTLTRDEYTRNGKFSGSTLERRFGGWKNVLKLCKLETKGHNFRYTFSDDDVVSDIKRVAGICKKDTVTTKEYDVYGTYSSQTLIARYKLWNNILEMSGLRVNLYRNFTDEELFEEIERIWIVLGRQPTTTDIKGGISKYSLNSYSRRFGGWRNALKAFLDYINDGIEGNECDSNNDITKKEVHDEQPDLFQHKTRRDVNLRMRFKVLQRDRFKCCACGASPSINSNVELHVDHIKPWSQGGETTMDNLQTLCSLCNLGKGNLM